MLAIVNHVKYPPPPALKTLDLDRLTYINKMMYSTDPRE